MFRQYHFQIKCHHRLERAHSQLSLYVRNTEFRNQALISILNKQIFIINNLILIPCKILSLKRKYLGKTTKNKPTKDTLHYPQLAQAIGTVQFNFRAGSTLPVPVCTVPHGHWANKADNQQYWPVEQG